MSRRLCNYLCSRSKPVCLFGIWLQNVRFVQKYWLVIITSSWPGAELGAHNYPAGVRLSLTTISSSAGPTGGLITTTTDTPRDTLDTWWRQWYTLLWHTLLATDTPDRDSDTHYFNATDIPQVTHTTEHWYWFYAIRTYQSPGISISRWNSPVVTRVTSHNLWCSPMSVSLYKWAISVTSLLLCSTTFHVT